MRGAAAIAVVLLSVGGVQAQSSEYLDFGGLTAELRTLVDASPERDHAFDRRVARG